MLASIYFLTVSYLQAFILVGPLILRDFISFLKNAGAFNIAHCIFEKICKKMKNVKKWCEGLQIAAELQKIKNANWKCVSPELPGISNTLYTFSTSFLSFPHLV